MCRDCLTNEMLQNGRNTRENDLKLIRPKEFIVGSSTQYEVNQISGVSAYVQGLFDQSEGIIKWINVRYM